MCVCVCVCVWSCGRDGGLRKNERGREEVKKGETSKEKKEARAMADGWMHLLFPLFSRHSFILSDALRLCDDSPKPDAHLRGVTGSQRGFFFSEEEEVEEEQS